MPGGEWVVLVEECGCCKQPYWAYLCYMSPDCPACDTIPGHFTVTITDGDGNTTDIPFSRYDGTPSVDVPCGNPTGNCWSRIYFKGFVKLKKNITIVGTELHDWCSSAHASLSVSDTGELVGSITVDGDGCASPGCAVLVPDEPCTGAFFGDVTSWRVMPAFPVGCSPSNPGQYPLSLNSMGQANWYDCCIAQGATFIAPNGDPFYTNTKYYGCWGLIDPAITIRVRFSCVLSGECLDMIRDVYVDTPFPNCDGYATISQSGGSTLLMYECEFTIAEWIAAGSPSVGWDCSNMTVSGGTVKFIGDDSASLLTMPIVFGKVGNYPPVYEASCEKGFEFPAHEWTTNVVMDSHEMVECFPGDGIHAFDEVYLHVNMVVKDYDIPVGGSKSMCLMDADAANITATGFGGNLQLRYDYEIVSINVDNKSHEVTIYVAAKCNGQGKKKIRIRASGGPSGAYISTIEAWPGEPISPPSDISSISGFKGWSLDSSCTFDDPQCWSPGFPYATMPEEDEEVYAVFEYVYWIYIYYPTEDCGGYRIGEVHPYHEGDPVALPHYPGLLPTPPCKQIDPNYQVLTPGGYPSTMPANDVEVKWNCMDEDKNVTITLDAGWGQFPDGSHEITLTGKCGTDVPSVPTPWGGTQIGTYGEYGPNRFFGWYDASGNQKAIPAKFSEDLTLHGRYISVPLNLNDVTNPDAPISDGVTGTGTPGSTIRYLKIANGASVEFKDVNIPGGVVPASQASPAIIIEGNATIILTGSNTIKPYDSNSGVNPGIYVPLGQTLTLSGTGTLLVAGLVGKRNAAAGSLVIENGRIEAFADYHGSAIGSGIGGSCENITITGGTVIATTNTYGMAGIGSNCGNILITGGTVTAIGGGNAAGIGTGLTPSDLCGTITVTDGVESVTAQKGFGAYASIGRGVESTTVGTVTVGGSVGEITQSPYTYMPE